MEGQRQGSAGGSVSTIDLDLLASEQNLSVPRAYDPAEDREHARMNLAYGLLALLAFVVVGLIAGVFLDLISVAGTKDLTGSILGPLIALVGTVTGFYFGARGNGA